MLRITKGSKREGFENCDAYTDFSAAALLLRGESF
jgi:hypothetical protein